MSRDKAPGKPTLAQIFQKGRIVRMDATIDTNRAIRINTNMPIPATEGPTMVDSISVSSP